MDQNRLILAIALSVAILFGFQLVLPHKPVPPPVDTKPTATEPAAPPPANPAALGTLPTQASAPSEPRDTPRVTINAPKLQGSVNLAGGRIDDLVLRDYHEEVAPSSPLVRLLEPRADPHPYYVQFGWTGDAGVKVPETTTVWSSSGGELSPGQPVTLSWDNGAGLLFHLVLSIDENYMFGIEQRVENKSGAEVKLYPWARIRRDYRPEGADGLIGVVDGKLEKVNYGNAKSESEKAGGGPALQRDSVGGWVGIDDRYWLTALIPDQQQALRAAFRYISENGADHYQVDYAATQPVSVAPGATASQMAHLFAGAKVVQLLDAYESNVNAPKLDKTVDFGWFFFLAKPMFYALDWLYHLVGNFGVAIMIFTVFVKAAFFPLANKSYKAMNKMKVLGPKMTEIRARNKDDPQKMQQEMMALYKAEKVNPASGCLPMLVQIPVFIALYSVLSVTIEMRHAPFFGWIHDLSAVDPTNVFNLFGLIPFDPAQSVRLLHLGAWPLIMGFTMFFQQRLNPPPPDPTQARIFQFMPLIFTFMLANSPAGLVIYWSWNNTLTILQQWTIMRRQGTRPRQMARSV